MKSILELLLAIGNTFVRPLVSSTLRVNPTQFKSGQMGCLLRIFLSSEMLYLGPSVLRIALSRQSSVLRITKRTRHSVSRECVGTEILCFCSLPVFVTKLKKVSVFATSVGFKPRTYYITFALLYSHGRAAATMLQYKKYKWDMIIHFNIRRDLSNATPLFYIRSAFPIADVAHHHIYVSS